MAGSSSDGTYVEGPAPSSEHIERAERLCVDTLRPLGATEEHVAAVVEAVCTYCRLEWGPRGLSNLALDIDAFDEHIVVAALRCWIKQLRALRPSRHDRRPWPGARIGFLASIEHVELDPQQRMLLDLVLQWGMTVEQCAVIVGTSIDETRAELREARRIIELNTSDLMTRPPTGESGERSGS